MKRAVAVLVLIAAVIAGGLAFPAGEARANPSGPASNACDPVTEARQRIFEHGGNTDGIDKALSKVCTYL